MTDSVPSGENVTLELALFHGCIDDLVALYGHAGGER
jgi:hypothetical protein